TQRVGSFFETAGHVAKSVFGEGKNRGNGHQCEQTTRGENVEPLADWKERYPLHERGMRDGADRFAEHSNPEKAQYNRRDGRNEFDVWFDQALLNRRGNLAHIDRPADTERNSN